MTPVHTMRKAEGFSLIELMIAMVLGILLSIGLVTVFAATNKTNRVDEALSRIQENGRYAITRLNSDLREVARQTYAVSGYFVPPTKGGAPVAPTAGTMPDGILNASIAPTVYVTQVPPTGTFPDMQTAISRPTNWPANTPWPLTPRNFIQGYECSTSACTPTVPTTGTPPIPDMAAANLKRVPNSDVLTVRYLDSDGWSLFRGELQPNTTASVPGACTGGPLLDISVTPSAGAYPSPALNFATGDLALLVVGSSAYLFQVSVSGSVLKPINVLGGNVPCVSGASSSGTTGTEATLYNFSKDFVTVTYYLQYDTDPADTKRLIPSLYRRKSDSHVGDAPTTEQVAQGLEQLNFLFGIAQTDSKVAYMTADLISGASTATTCPPEPSLYATTQQSNGTIAQVEPACLWGGVKSIETHLLADTINNMYDLTNPDMAYIYSDGVTVTTYDGQSAPPAKQPSGINFGNMLRREFVSLNSVRNYNP
jgi:type IV pilus assembly protein PilW